MTAATTARAKNAVGNALGREPATLLATDLAGAFPWLHRTSLHLVRPVNETQRWLVVDVPGATPRLVESTLLLPDLDALGALVDAEKLSLPHDLVPKALADLVRLFVVGARSKVVAEDVVVDLASYAPRTETLALALRASATTGPTVVREPGGFTLSFELVLPNGAVDRWTLRGNARAFTGARRSSVAPPGSYHYPWIG